AVMIKAGISLPDALGSLSNQSKSTEVKKILTQIKNKIDNGSSFTNALNFYPNNFDQLYIGIVKVGESTGNLDKSLSYLADQMGKNYALFKKIKGALMYPALILFATISLITFISLFILPKLVDFFAAFDAKLPATTVILMSLASFMKNYGILFFSSIFVVIFMIFLLFKIPSIRLWKDRQILYLPFIGRLLIEREVSTFARNLATLIKSGLPIFESLKICGPSQSNFAYKKTINDLSNNLEKGSSISEFLNKPSCRLLFPSLVSDMLAVGEKTGSTDQSLDYISQFYEDDIEETAANLTTILEPALLLIIGLVVAFVALAIISPIYQLTGSLG
ncbi:MAG: type II secretion system F family protein, partial [Candidatus Shapirobacteria bacterium]|nr:type II secretion system F family protein [Candidatus Shapirobacteria bacterium]